jgi:lysophospholipid acyltransferase (LPLAT)-like uncharacterized protein
MRADGGGAQGQVVAVVARFLLWVVRWLGRTLRVNVIGPEPDPSRAHIYAFLHGRQLPLLRYPREREVAVLSSLSRDGSLQAEVLAALGFTVIRGSSSRRGAEGLVSLVRAVREGASAALAVDGPRGPLGLVKPGALFVARAAGALVVPITSAARRAFRLGRSWDRFMLPLPWSQVLIARGDAFEVPRSGGEEELERARLQLERALAQMSDAADASVGRDGVGL